MPELPEIIQLKIRLLGISPMIWRRVLIPSATTLRELHGVLQVAMGWESIHLYQFDDKVNREFVAQTPNQLWVSDFTYVSRWQGMVYVAFVIDVFARKIVGWRVSTSMTTSFVLDALNQAICQRCPSEADNLIHHSDRGAQYLAIKYTERLAEAGIDPSVGSVGDSYDNALAESTIGLFKTEVINFLGTRKSMGQIEWETLKWVNWYNNERLHSAIGYVTPQEAEEAFYANMNNFDKVA